MENTATPRQRWALFCITKKDYRNEILSKEEAAKLIKELGTSDYKKSDKKPIKSLADELLDYLMEHIDELYQDCLTEMSYKSVIEDDEHVPEDKRNRYMFIGFGCGITWLTYRKNSNKAKEIDEAAHTYRNHQILKALIDKLPNKDYEYMQSVGCPFEAMWQQMQNLQCSYYYMVKQFAENHGIKMNVKSVID